MSTAPRYPYVHVDVPADEADVLSAELFELGASGIEERDASTLVKGPAALAALRRDEVGGDAAGASLVTLVASFDSDELAQAACAELGERFKARVEHVEGDGWRDGWKAYFKPTRVGTRLVVKPSWEPYDAAPRDLVLTLDPAGAFGTGTHETTRLVLGELEEIVVPGQPVLDVGTGSGILAIGCCLLGASRVRALDIDDESVNACIENAEANGVRDRIEVDKTPVQTLTERYPLVLANIETRILVPLKATIMALVEPGGVLVLSGILRSEVETAKREYASFALLKEREQGEWAALVLRSPS
jgi:ribosomal protein L11 methyltransferase